MVPTRASQPTGITAGPDGNLWFTESRGNKIGRITPDGTITEFQVPTAASQPKGIVADAKGHVWFTQSTAGKIGRLDPDAASPTRPASPVPTPTATPSPSGVRCVGDCTGTGSVAIDDLVRLVTIASGHADSSACPHGIPPGTDVTITTIIAAVGHALGGCAGASEPQCQ